MTQMIWAHRKIQRMKTKLQMTTVCLALPFLMVVWFGAFLFYLVYDHFTNVSGNS